MQKVGKSPGPRIFVILTRVFGPSIAVRLAVRECFRRCVGKTSWFSAFASVILVCTLPVNADTLPASHAAAPDRLFDASLLVSAGELPSVSADSALQPGVKEDALAFRVVPSESETLDLLAGRRDDRSESGEAGVRRFLVLAIIFGAALRYLTSPAFYDWAADIFDPLDEY